MIQTTGMEGECSSWPVLAKASFPAVERQDSEPVGLVVRGQYRDPSCDVRGRRVRQSCQCFTRGMCCKRIKIFGLSYVVIQMGDVPGLCPSTKFLACSRFLFFCFAWTLALGIPEIVLGRVRTGRQSGKDTLYFVDRVGSGQVRSQRLLGLFIWYAVRAYVRAKSWWEGARLARKFALVKPPLWLGLLGMLRMCSAKSICGCK